MDAIEIKSLTKSFNGLIAVDSISLKIKEGELFGLLGPNGAGKTTTISMLCTILKPTSGEAKVWGFDIKKEQDEVRNSIGIVFQDPSLDDELTAYENLDFHGRVYNIPKDTRQKRINALLKLVELEDKKGALVKTFSGGMKRRLEIARGLMHRPKILFLDEPTLGLDPQTRRHIWQYVKELNKKEKITVVLTTHYIEEADALCGRVGIIDHGKIIALDTTRNLKSTIGGDDIISLDLSDSQRLAKSLAKLKWVKKLKVHNHYLNLSVERAEQKIPLLMKRIEELGVEVESVTIHKPTLEDVFIHVTGRSIREQEANKKDRARIIRRIRKK